MLPPCFCALAGTANRARPNAVARKIRAALRERIAADREALMRVAQETANLTRAQILVQATTSVLAQANSAPEAILKLLS